MVARLKRFQSATALVFSAALTWSFAPAPTPEICPSLEVAKSSYYSPWQARYPTSLSGPNVVNGTNRSCVLCHATGGGDNYNGYGWTLFNAMLQGLTLAEAIQFAETIDSDLDPAASTNLDEMLANSQPGWTDGPNNTFYFSDGTTLPNQPPPAAILGNFDPTTGDPDIDVSPTTLDFGTVAVGQSVTLTTTIQNLGPVDLTVSGLTLQGGQGFSLSAPSPQPPFVVRPNESVDVFVDFAPTAEVPSSDVLRIASNDPIDPLVDVTLSGVGTATPVPDIEINPTVLSFGSVGVGSTKTLSFTISNVGTGNLTVTVLRMGGAGNPAFSLNPAAPTPPVVIPPNGSVEVPVDMHPSATGWHVGVIDVWSDDPIEWLKSVSLGGTGVVGLPDIQVAPLSLDFGSVPVGTTAMLQTTITNVGTADLTVTSLSVQGAPQFALGAQAPSAPFVVPVSGSIIVPVEFVSALGNHFGTLDIVSDDGDEPEIGVNLAASGSATEIVDLDIRSFRVTGRYKPGRQIEIQLRVENNGTATGARLATVTGTQDGTVVYVETMMVQDSLSNGSTRYDFPSHTPSQPLLPGDISWEAIIADDDPDDDRAFQTTSMPNN